MTQRCHRRTDHRVVACHPYLNPRDCRILTLSFNELIQVLGGGRSKKRTSSENFLPAWSKIINFADKSVSFIRLDEKLTRFRSNTPRDVRTCLARRRRSVAAGTLLRWGLGFCGVECPGVYAPRRGESSTRLLSVAALWLGRADDVRSESASSGALVALPKLVRREGP